MWRKRLENPKNPEMTRVADYLKQLLTDSWHPAKRVHAFVSLWANRKVPKMGPKVRCVAMQMNGNMEFWDDDILSDISETFSTLQGPIDLKPLLTDSWHPAERGHASDCHFFITNMLKVLQNAWNSEIRRNFKQCLRLSLFHHKHAQSA